VNGQQQFFFTAAVSANSPGSGTPTGTVNFQEISGQLLGSAPVINGTANFQTSFTAGTQTVEAIYETSTDYLTSTSNEVTETITRVGTRASKVVVVSSQNPSILGNAVTFTATVKDAGVGAAQTPTGTVSFLDGTTLLGYGTLSTVNGVMTATFTTSALPQGADSITAAYNGNTTFAHAVSAAITQTVNVSPTRTSSTALASSSIFNSGTNSYSSTYSQAVKFTATVTDTGASPAQTPTGTVTFSYTIPGSTAVHVLGTATLSGSGGVATAAFSTSTLAVGSYTISATYNGSKVFAVGTPASIAQNVVKIGSTTALKSSTPSDMSVFGRSITFTATVTRSTGGSPAGNVVFTNQTTGKVLGTVALNANGVASVTTAALAFGDNTIVATYQGNANVAGSSQTLTQTVIEDSSKVSLAPSTTQSNTPLTLTATVAAVAPGTGTPTGTINFYIDGAFKGMVTMVNGKASLTLSSGLSTGNHTIEAIYSGDDDFVTSSQTITIDFTVSRGT
jgi:hypothetical protein